MRRNYTLAPELGALLILELIKTIKNKKQKQMEKETLTINKSNALQAFSNTDSTGKALLTDLFGKEVFTPKKITDRVKTWGDVCQIAGIDTMHSLPYPLPCNADQKAVNGFFMASVIAKVLNEGWEPNWGNSSEYKYYPWFEFPKDSSKSTGFDLSYHVCDHSGTHTTVGSRLVFKTAELAKYAGIQFISVYETFQTLNK
jgi:hypothetical protein